MRNKLAADIEEMSKTVCELERTISEQKSKIIELQELLADTRIQEHNTRERECKLIGYQERVRELDPKPEGIEETHTTRGVHR